MDDPRIAGCPLRFEGRSVHVWPVRTEASTAVVERFEPFLSMDEKVRAAQFRFDHLRDRYVIARGALRALLGCFLNIAPASVRFEYGSNGKPALAAPEFIHFNVSHSAGLAVFAFTQGC